MGVAIAITNIILPVIVAVESAPAAAVASPLVVGVVGAATGDLKAKAVSRPFCADVEVKYFLRREGHGKTAASATSGGNGG